MKIKQLKIAVAVACLLLSGGCTRRVYVPVESTAYHVDTLWQTALRIDSVFLHDSVSTYFNGDTVIITRFRDRLRYRNRRDTVYRAVTDTARIAVPYPVQRKLSRWQQAKMDFGGWAMAALCITALVALLRLRKRS